MMASVCQIDSRPGVELLQLEARTQRSKVDVPTKPRTITSRRP